MSQSEQRQSWWVYIMECSDGSYYTGITTDIDRRVRQHNAGRGAKYTRSRLPVSEVYSEHCESKSAALKREYRVKQLNRQEKEQLIESISPG